MHTDEEKLMENQLSNPTPLYLRVAAGPPINEGRFVRGSRGPLELFSWTLLRPRGPPIKPALFDRGPRGPPLANRSSFIGGPTATQRGI